jgi:hypothetical protein
MRRTHLALGIAAALVTMAMVGTAAAAEGYSSVNAIVGATAAADGYSSPNAIAGATDVATGPASGAATPEYRSPDVVLADRGGVHPDVVGHNAGDYSSLNALAGAPGTDAAPGVSPVAAASSDGVDFSDVAFGALGGFVLAVLGFWGITALMSRGRRRRIHGTVGA